MLVTGLKVRTGPPAVPRAVRTLKLDLAGTYNLAASPASSLGGARGSVIIGGGVGGVCCWQLIHLSTPNTLALTLTIRHALQAALFPLLRRPSLALLALPFPACKPSLPLHTPQPAPLSSGIT